MIFHVEVEVEGENGGAPQEQYEPRPSITAGGSSTRAGQVTYSGGVGTSQPSALAEAAGAGAAVGPDGFPVAAEEDIAPVVEQRRVDAEEQIGRNDPCWCGSGKKYKKCHGA
jgi:preprotein translocase subunit SecA